MNNSSSTLYTIFIPDSLVFFFRFTSKKWSELIGKAWSESSLRPLFETEGPLDNGQRNSFYESLDSIKNSTHDTSKNSEVHLIDVNSWVANPFSADSPGALTTSKKVPEP